MAGITTVLQPTCIESESEEPIPRWKPDWGASDDCDPTNGKDVVEKEGPLAKKSDGS
jgi:hypothetical protein